LMTVSVQSDVTAISCLSLIWIRVTASVVTAL
jgi:hypothetical protein